MPGTNPRVVVIVGRKNGEDPNDYFIMRIRRSD